MAEPVRVRKAVIPVAGLGTRFLPVTKAVPKELLPVVDTPMIQLVVEEALQAGLTDIILVTSRGKAAIEDFFDHAYELERTLRERHKLAELAELEQMTRVRPLAVRQKEPRGLGHAILTAEQAAAAEPVAVLLPDDLFDHQGHSAHTAIGQLCEVFSQTGGEAAVIAVEQVASECADQYGIVLGEPLPEPGSQAARLLRLHKLIEKPPRDSLPPALSSVDAIVGRYVLPAAIWPFLHDTPPGRGGEIQLTDALVALLQAGHPCYGYRLQADHFDGGNRLGWLAANLHYALKRPSLRPQLFSLLQQFIRDS